MQGKPGVVPKNLAFISSGKNVFVLPAGQAGSPAKNIRRAFSYRHVPSPKKKFEHFCDH